MHASIRVANAEFRLHEIGAGISVQFASSDIYLPRSGRTRWIAVASTTSNGSGLNHSTAVAQRGMQIGFIITTWWISVRRSRSGSIRMFYNSVFAFDVYTNRSSQAISPREFRRFSGMECDESDSFQNCLPNLFNVIYFKVCRLLENAVRRIQRSYHSS